jgi:hypothetical protein
MSSAARAKRDRERAKQEKSVKKKADREAAAVVAAEEAAIASGKLPTQTQEQLLAALQNLHEQFEKEAISFDEFDEAKQALIEQIAVA